MNPSRREFIHAAGLASISAMLPTFSACASSTFRLRYALCSTLFGKMPLEEVVRAAHRSGCEALDVWPEVHANHREQIEQIGHERFATLLRENGQRVGMYTCMHRGKGFEPWLETVRRFGGDLIITGVDGRRVPSGGDVRAALQDFANALKPDIEIAQRFGVRIAVENHSGGLLRDAETMAMFLELVPETVGIALTPFYLPQEPALIASIIAGLGPRLLHFYAWQYGRGNSEMPAADLLQQLPGVGPLDFGPLVAALKNIRFGGLTSVLMHSTPRGKPMHPTATAVTDQLNRCHAYLNACADRA